MKLIERLLVAYRALAWVTGVGLALLVCVAMPLKYIWGIPQPTTVIGIAHGWFYMFYVLVTLVLAERCRWRPVRVVLIALAGTVPFASFFAERKVTRTVREETLAKAG
jgi:integral membrane protein